MVLYFENEGAGARYMCVRVMCVRVRVCAVLSFMHVALRLKRNTHLLLLKCRRRALFFLSDRRHDDPQHYDSFL